MMRVLVMVLAGTPAIADPLFEDRSAGLPDHVYDGGWEHFVGGGVAVFDCNGDALPDIFAAGGENPAKMMVNEGNMTFNATPIEEMTGVTGAYPLDVNGDGFMDLFVMRVGQNRLMLGDGACAFAQGSLLPPSDDWTTAFSAWWDADDHLVMAVGN
ncbi:FG-GAP repeat domain-containing protein, partial [Roseobacter sp. CCS2]|uniref:FG-GAP repeat domain-containing protein n=1 Tax=Roseobacter sp. CCS2 TaxID=391593 RepID=UPI0000F3C3E5